MKAIKISYEIVCAVATKSGTCPICNKNVSRKTKFEFTVNPFNKNSDGTVKTKKQVQEELDNEIKKWLPDFTHEKCKTLKSILDEAYILKTEHPSKDCRHFANNVYNFLKKEK